MTLTMLELMELGIDQLRPNGLDAPLSKQKLVNRAGRLFCGMRSWKFLEKRSGLLDIRGDIAVTAGEWIESSKTLKETGTFEDYTFVDGDVIEITGGTNATTGTYSVASRTDDDNIVLSTSIGATANGSTDITATFDLPTIALPSDFKELRAIVLKDTVFNGFNPTSVVHIAELEASDVDVSGPWLYSGVIVHVGTPPTPVIRIHPTPTTDDNEAFICFYRAKWTELTNDSAVVAVPDYAEEALIQVTRALVKGYMEGEDDQPTLSQRLADIRAGDVFRQAVRDDALVQPYHGPIRGSAIRSNRRIVPGSLRTQVAAPG
jgi:hypothetical protein